MSFFLRKERKKYFYVKAFLYSIPKHIKTTAIVYIFFLLAAAHHHSTDLYLQHKKLCVGLIFY